MTITESFAYITSFMNFEKDLSRPRPFGLEKMHRLLKFFDNPQLDRKYIHVAGSKGKGSTAAFCAGILKARGLGGGLYTSPHVESWKERITLAGQPFPDDVYIRQIQFIKEKIGEPDLDDPEHKPTVFELMTLLAFLIFKEQNLSWCVLETGLGGRLDATNVIIPEACIITPIELEHTAILGNTISLIAGEKAGIIKDIVPVFTAELHPDALAVMKTVALSKNTLLTTIPNHNAWLTENGDACINLGDRVLQAHLPFPGLHQARNAALATTAILKLLGESALPQEILVTGLKSAFLPARFEIFSISVPNHSCTIPVVLDTAHTPASFQVLLDEVKRRFTGKGSLCIGLASDKKIAEICAMSAQFFSTVTVTNLGPERENFPVDLVRHFLLNGIVADLVEDSGKALESILQCKPDFLVISGSFHLAGHVRRLLCPQSVT